MPMGMGHGQPCGRIYYSISVGIQPVKVVEYFPRGKAKAWALPACPLSGLFVVAICKPVDIVTVENAHQLWQSSKRLKRLLVVFVSAYFRKAPSFEKLSTKGCEAELPLIPQGEPIEEHRGDSPEEAKADLGWLVGAGAGDCVGAIQVLAGSLTFAKEPGVRGSDL
eukprot:CAMPEP_0198352436 /NCGR_PEP_ID=MMETSP1450-20131203/107150_1 /TAXON_ID=753684 ORGANISM="Madagascaria erythrocladiodes, Strain CCMP3234" /NCGR_SAMPLE_ID=MMETSP1450 /ASSEMBLY_ACC=CAM_ASM_001115 /LENGTH=165 /DNA_ID=CAMNT_0044058463 /DNA_START=100 /DNA_END=598 /DNA_ORIENTATION=-